MWMMFNLLFVEFEGFYGDGAVSTTSAVMFVKTVSTVILDAWGM